MITVPQIAEKALAATVSLEMSDQNGAKIYGSGFFVKRNLIATNYHVIAGAVSGTAKLVGKDTTYKVEGCTATDEDNNLALLKVMAYGIKPLPLGDSDAIRVRETVYVAGNSKGLEGTFSDGIVSSHSDVDVKDRLQMIAPISRGISSGGPVLNTRGEVIGVSVAAPRGVDAQNLNFAILSNSLKRLLGQTEHDKLVWDSHTVSAEIYFLRSYALCDLELYEAAIEAYTQALRLEADYADAYHNRGVVKRILGQYFEAIGDFDAAIRLKPDYAFAYHNRGVTEAYLGQHLVAILDYNEAIRFKPDFAEAYLNRGRAKAKLGDHSAALSDYDEVIRLKPDFAEAYLNRGNAKSRLRQYSTAVSDYDAVIRLKPDYAFAYLRRGVLKGALGQNLAAIHDYDAVLRLKPDEAKAYFHRGRAKAKLGDHSAAISDYDEAICLKPDYALALRAKKLSNSALILCLKNDLADAYLNRGNVMVDLGDHSGAVSDYDAVICLKSDDARVYLVRGLAKAQLDRMWEAKQDLQTALRLAEQAGDMDTKAKAEEALRTIQ